LRKLDGEADRGKLKRDTLKVALKSKRGWNKGTEKSFVAAGS
jgi:hypothetical protein